MLTRCLSKKHPVSWIPWSSYSLAVSSDVHITVVLIVYNEPMLHVSQESFNVVFRPSCRGLLTRWHLKFGDVLWPGHLETVKLVCMKTWKFLLSRSKRHYWVDCTVTHFLHKFNSGSLWWVTNQQYEPHGKSIYILKLFWRKLQLYQ